MAPIHDVSFSIIWAGRLVVANSDDDDDDDGDGDEKKRKEKA